MKESFYLIRTQSWSLSLFLLREISEVKHFIFKTPLGEMIMHG